MRRGVRRSETAVVAVVALALCAAPTVGDVGGCGAQATDLSASAFGAQRKLLDCQRCSECGLHTSICGTECNPRATSDVAWPATCRPLQHDGDVCLRALRSASCAEYASFVADAAPATPTECDFCHEVQEAGPEQGEL